MLKRALKRVIGMPPVAKTIFRLNRVAQSAYQDDISTRYSPENLFRNLNMGEKDVSRSSFIGLEPYILTDQIVPEHTKKLGSVIESLDDFTDEKISKSVFFVYFLCDSDALPHIRRIARAGGKYVPHLSFDKTEYRFVERLALNALRRTWMKRERVSHLSPIVHENICEALHIARQVKGDFVEIGVFRGGSALTAINFMDELSQASPALPRRKAWLFDTFDGFQYDAAYASADAIWAGTHVLDGVEKTKAVIKDTLSGTSVPFQLIACNICTEDLPTEIKEIAVANIDVDMFEPTYSALVKVSDKIAKGGIIICEDPASTPSLYGALHAMEDFLDTEQGRSYVKVFKKGQYFLLKTR